MSIKILMLIFIVVLIITASYLIKSYNRDFFIIFPLKQDKNIKKLFIGTAIALLVISLVGVLILFTLDKDYNFITLILGTFSILLFSTTFVHIN